jgi:hypothetical protein
MLRSFSSYTLQVEFAMKTVGVIAASIAISACGSSHSVRLMRATKASGAQSNVSELDGSVLVSATKTDSGKTGRAAIRVMNHSIEDVRTSSIPMMAAGAAWLAVSLQLNDENERDTACRDGVDDLGTEYNFDPRFRIKDDTGTKLLVAQLARDNMEWQLAASLTCSVLSARLQIYHRYFHNIGVKVAVD